MKPVLRLVLGLALLFGAGCAGSSDGPKPSGDDAADDDDDDIVEDDDSIVEDDDDDRPSGGNPDAGGARLDASSDARANSDKSDSGGGKSEGGSSAPDNSKGPPINGFVNLAVKPSTPLNRTKGDTHPSMGFTPPAGWNWYNVEGAKCRDGSQQGMFVRFVEGSKKLFIYLEGGGACSNPGFCRLNPININQQFLTGGESALASLFILPIPQAPNGAGVFDTANAANPFKDWNQVFIPYCTGDVHFGATTEGMVNGVTGKQNFVGATNMKLTVAHLAATFTGLERFVIGGPSAGAFGAGLNFGMVQDTFGEDVPGMALLDAGPPFSNEYIPSCLQKIWRETWKLDENLPSDCKECKTEDGGGLMSIVDYWRKKYKAAKVSLISGVADEIIRLFFSLGNDNCGNINADPELAFIGTLGQTYDPAKFKAGLLDLRTRYMDTGQFATFYMDGFPNSTAHQCLFRPRFYEEAAGAGKGTVAEWVTKFLAGEMTQVGP